jgi:hypothetical protein
MQLPKASLDPPRGLRAFRRKIILAIVLVLALGIVVSFVRAWPWLAAPAPERVAKAWDTVERAAVTPPVPPFDADAWAAFLDATRAASPTLTKLDARDMAARSEETLPGDVDESLVRLVAWAEASKNAPGRASPVSACGDAREVVSIARLANVAFRARPSETRVEAFVRASAHLRRSGGLLQHRVGVRILELALRSVPAGTKPALVFRDLRATVDELRGAMARDALCIDEMFARGPANDERVTAEQAPKAPWLARRLVRIDRERAMLRLQAGERLAECAGPDDDGRTFAQCYARAVERDDVPSVMSRAVAVNPPPIDEVLTLQRDVLSH